MFRAETTAVANAFSYCLNAEHIFCASSELCVCGFGWNFLVFRFTIIVGTADEDEGRKIKTGSCT